MRLIYLCRSEDQIQIVKTVSIEIVIIIQHHHFKEGLGLEVT